MFDDRYISLQESLYETSNEIIKNGRWDAYLEGIVKSQPNVDDMTLKNTALMLENFDRRINQLDEASKAVNFGSFIHYGFDLISAIMPSLIANQIVSVQAQTRRIGEIFFMDFNYGSTKGSITANDTMLGALNAGNPNTFYTTEEIQAEVIGTGTGSSAHITGIIDYIPVVATSLTITTTGSGSPAATYTVTDNGNGSLVGDVDPSGTNTINYATGAFDVTFTGNVGLGERVLATYNTDFEANPDNIGEVDVNITALAITAQPWRLRARYTLDAMYDLKQHFGKDIDMELATALASEIRMEQDGSILKDIKRFATGASGSFSKTPPSTNISYREHKFTFIDTLINMSNQLFFGTRRAQMNFIVGGLETCNVIESLENRFHRTGKPQAGPHLIGNLDNTNVYKNPYFSANEFIIGYKGDTFLETGYVWAPYLVLYTTQTIMLDDFVGRKGLASDAGRMMVNPKFYGRGTVTA